MMKKLLLLALVLVAASISMLANRTLVVYYSYTGNTKAIVNELTSQIDADVLEIQPAEEGLDYAANNYALGSQLIQAIKNNPNDASSYPAIKAVSVDLTQYNVVIVATPLWWSQMAAPMQTFLFQNGSKLAGKHIGLIVSSYSSSISGVESDAKRLIPQGDFTSSLWINNAKFSSRSSLVQQWLTDIDYNNISSQTLMQVSVTVGSSTFLADIEDSETGRAFIAKLPLTLNMSELNGNEKYCYGVELPTASQYYSTINAGDLMLYGSNCVVLFYGTAGGYSYTRIGKLTSTDGLASALGSGAATVKFEAITTGITDVKAANAAVKTGIFDIQGRQLSEAPDHGIYIENGQKKVK